MLLLETLKSHLNSECAIIYREFSAICGTNIHAAAMLSKFVYWSDIASKDTSRHGWFFKTARNLRDELGLTRRGYEKARAFLISKGLLQYRRSGVHGKMYFCVHFGRLLEMVYQLKGIDIPADVLKTQTDKQNTVIPKWIPLGLWNNYLDIYKAKKGKYPSNKQKSALIKQLARLRTKFDLAVIIERSIVGGWIGFFAPDNQTGNGNSSVQIINQLAHSTAPAQEEKPPTNQPRSDEQKQKAAAMFSNMMKSIQKSSTRKQG